MEETYDEIVKTYIYHGVVEGVKAREFTVIETKNKKTGEKTLHTEECEQWWKDNYTKENGAFWYKVS